MNKTILVVDDDMMNLKMAQFALQKDSYDVITANSGAKCLDILRSGAIVDLVLLDIEMPVMNGFQTFKYILNEFSNVPVIFLTASGDKDDVLEVMRMGAVGYVKKPFRPEDLLERVTKVFEKN